MAKTWNLEQLIDRLKTVHGYNEGQTDQDWEGPSGDSDKHFRSFINEAYVDEVEEAAQIADTRHFQRIATFTWPASSSTVTVPDELVEKTLVSIHDTTDNAIGEEVYLLNRGEGGMRFWQDGRTLQWGTSGPSSAKTLTVTYLAEPDELEENTDVPVLIPRRFRHLLVWAAAMKMRTVADDQVPRDFVRQRDEIRERFHKALSMGRPIESGYNGIRNTDPDSTGLSPW